MDAAVAISPWLCLTVSILTVVMLPIRYRGAAKIRDAQLGLYAQPRLNIVLAVFMVLFALGTIVLGIGLIGAGYLYAWGLIPLAGAQIFTVVFFVWIVRQPFDE